MKKETVRTKNSTKSQNSKSNQPTNEQLSREQRSLFLGAAMTMSWQLAIAVLLPVLGGYALDNHLDSSPLWTIIGFVVALACAVLVVWRQSQILSPNGTTSRNDSKERRK